jgi:hypothetical protein
MLHIFYPEVDMQTISSVFSFFKRNPFALFVLLSYLISWSIVLPTGGLLLSWGPMLAALIVVRFTQGKNGVKALWNQVTQRNTRLRWYLLAVAISLAVTLITVSANILLGAQISPHFDWSVALRGLPLLLVTGGQWEEPGWTGYALPKMLKRFGNAPYGVLVAALVVAAVRTAWHLPLMLYGHIYWSDILLNFAYQIVVTWMFKKSRNSVLIVMLLHLMNNMISGQIAMQFFAGSDWVRYFRLHAIVWSLLAAGVLILARSSFGRQAAPATTVAAQTSQPLM